MCALCAVACKDLPQSIHRRVLVVRRYPVRVPPKNVGVGVAHPFRDPVRSLTLHQQSRGERMPQLMKRLSTIRDSGFAKIAPESAGERPPLLRAFSVLRVERARPSREEHLHSFLAALDGHLRDYIS